MTDPAAARLEFLEAELRRIENSEPGPARSKELAFVLGELAALGQPATEAAEDAEQRAIADQAARQKAAIDRQAEAETRALDAFGLAAILEAVTPADDVSLDAWRADMDAKLERADEELAALRAEADAAIRDTEARLAQGNKLDREDTNDEMEEDVEDERTPLARATKLMDTRLTAIRRYVYSKLTLPWVGYSAPAVIMAVDTAAQLATVRLQDGSGATVDGVEYGSGTPVVGAPTTLNVPVKVPPDPRRPLVQPVPAGRCWITVPPGGKFAYYEYAGKLWKVPWPLTDPDAEPELVRDLWASSPFGTEHGWHPEQNLGFDGQGTWWIALSWEDVAFGGLTTHYRLLGWDALGTGEVHLYSQGDESDQRAEGRQPLIWAVDPTPGHTGFMGFWDSHEIRSVGSAIVFTSEGPKVVPILNQKNYGQIAFTDTPSGGWVLGPRFLLSESTGHSDQIGRVGTAQGNVVAVQDYRRQIFEYNAYQTWHEGNVRRARWGLQPRRDLHESATRFYDEASTEAELSNAGYWSIWWAGPDNEPGRLTLFLMRENGVEVTRRDPDGSLHPLAWPDGFDPGPPRRPYPAGQDRTLTNLLAVDASHVYWASEDRGATWYRCPFQLPWRQNFEGGRWAYIIDETEYTAA